MPDRYVVIGNPVAHSKSPHIHALFAEQTGQTLIYERLLAPLDDFAGALKDFRDGGGCGANITVPFKQEAFQVSQGLTARAARAEAVNTIWFDGSTIVGDNTDGAGLVADITHNLAQPLVGRSILVLGAGGAVRGVLQPLLTHRPQRVVLANRTLARAEELVACFGGSGTPVKACEFAGIDGPFDIVINGTSASLANEVPPVPDSVFGPDTLVYDMMYAAGGTAFMQHARARGASRVADGLGMLVEQAAEAFQLWRGVRPQTAPVLELLRGVR